MTEQDQKGAANPYDEAYAAPSGNAQQPFEQTSAPAGGSAPETVTQQSQTAGFADTNVKGTPAQTPQIPGYAYGQPTYAYATQPQAAYAAPQKKSHGWIVAIVVIVCVFLLILGSFVSCSMVAGNVVASMDPYSTEDAIGELHEPAIGVIELNGTIQYDGSACSPEGLQILLDRAQDSNYIQGVILKVNSGGGVATAGEEMSKAVSEFEKPIVVVSQATNASAAYEISSQADYIFTDRTTAIGAIGVIMSVTDLSGLYDKLGISVENIKSADSKDAGSGNRPLTEEERAWYQSMVDQINNVFIETVAEGRGIDVDDVRALANGLPYTGIDAVRNGLADEIGSTEDAVEYISEILGYDEPLPTIDMVGRASELASILDLLGSNSDEFDSARLKDLINELDGGSVAQ